MDARHHGLTRAVAEGYLEAARVCLSRHHDSPVDFEIRDEYTSTAVVEWESPDERIRGAWANEIDATEAGAYCCAIAALEHSRGLHAVRRAETATGADYYVGETGAGVEHLEDCYRLEVSGVSAGNEAVVARRVVQKVNQARVGNSALPAIAAVVGFERRAVVIQDVPDEE